MWFQNRRAKFRRNERNASATTVAAVAGGGGVGKYPDAVIDATTFISNGSSNGSGSVAKLINTRDHHH